MDGDRLFEWLRRCEWQFEKEVGSRPLRGYKYRTMDLGGPYPTWGSRVLNRINTIADSALPPGAGSLGASSVADTWKLWPQNQYSITAQHIGKRAEGIAYQDVQGIQWSTDIAPRILGL